MNGLYFDFNYFFLAITSIFLFYIQEVLAKRCVFSPFIQYLQLSYSFRLGT